MVTAVLPTMSYVEQPTTNEPVQRLVGESRHTHAPSIASELTITPARFQSSSRRPGLATDASATSVDVSSSTSKIAGFVGMFTGFGALLALFLFLPLPATFQHRGLSPGRALQHSYYIVAAIALILSICCFFGLRKLKSETRKGWRYLFRGSSASGDRVQLKEAASEIFRNLYQALNAGFRRSDIGIGYLGGFVARASSVGISLFIPLLVNASFLNSDLCGNPSALDRPAGLPDIKRRCPRAYVVAAELTGVAEVVALVAAPLFGYWSARTTRKTLPLATASIAGIIGYPLFATRFDPDDTNKGDRAIAFVAVCLIGFSQIGAIVCSLASLSTGVLADAHASRPVAPHAVSRNQNAPTDTSSESQPLLRQEHNALPLSDMKGSVAGIYSFYGGAAILLLTKAGGALFDTVSNNVPFVIMAAFNGILLIATVAIGVKQSRATSAG